MTSSDFQESTQARPNALSCGRWGLVTWLLAGTMASLQASPPTREASSPRPRLGINLAGPCDWNTELPLADVFRMSRPWISQQQGTGWGHGPPLDVDAHGWVRRLEPGCSAETLVCTLEGHYPAGEYTVLYDGEGILEFANSARALETRPGRISVRVSPEKGAIFLRLKQTNPENYVRNIRILMPGLERTYEENPWNPELLRRWQGIACLRYMDFMQTNNSPIVHWSQRPTLEDATTSEKGVPLELLIDLANRLHADPWFCMPHQADDDYVTNFARLVHQRLAPDRRVYIEYSNEVWNSQFQQHRFAGERGQHLSLGEKPWEAAWHYTARRSVEIFSIWEQEFGGVDRLVRVLASQAANPYVARQIVTFGDAYRHADALAIAPYISFNVAPTGGRISAEQVQDWSVDRLLDDLEQNALPESVRWVEENKRVADEYGLKLVAYEGGQHLVGVYGAENNERLTARLQAANRHPRMGQIYARYLAAWQRAGGDLFCHFSSVSRWSKWGSWGLLEYSDDRLADAPKFLATTRWARQLGQPVLDFGSAAPGGGP